MNNRTNGVLTFMVFLVILGGFGYVVYNNSQSETPLRVIVPTQIDPTAVANSWELVLEAGFGDDSTSRPPILLPTQPFSAPTLPPVDSSSVTPVSAAQLGGNQLFTLEPVSIGMTATPIPPSSTPNEFAVAIGGEANIGENTPEVEIEERFVQQPTVVPRPPPLDVPLNLDPQGRDHYIFLRPVDSLGMNSALPSYPYGADGVLENNPSRVHHGIDMPNPVGLPIRAAGSGTIVFASTPENPYFQNTASYGFVVVIEHDFGWQGRTLYTLYAHLEQALVSDGQYVQAGDVIALNGNTGRSTGPHLHFEVRIDENRYGSTYNPVLWLAPYVGHGTIAGELLDERGNRVQNATITIRNWGNGVVLHTTNTYAQLDTVNDVNSDLNWDENFAVGDVRAGRYEVIASFDGQRLSKVVDVFEGRTTFVALSPDDDDVIVHSDPNAIPTVEENDG